jgi:hypothetical protein
MSQVCEKLPTKLGWEMFQGDAKLYIETLYKIFKRDFIQNTLQFQGKNVDIIHEKYFEGKERSFWHMISEGEEDASRKLNVERCASIPYVKVLITENGDCDNYRIWKKWHDKTNKERYYIWCVVANYMVILEDRITHYKLITAYNVLECMVKSYEKAYRKYGQTKTPTY